MKSTGNFKMPTFTIFEFALLKYSRFRLTNMLVLNHDDPYLIIIIHIFGIQRKPILQIVGLQNYAKIQNNYV